MATLIKREAFLFAVLMALSVPCSAQAQRRVRVKIDSAEFACFSEYIVEHAVDSLLNLAKGRQVVAYFDSTLVESASSEAIRRIGVLEREPNDAFIYTDSGYFNYLSSGELLSCSFSSGGKALQLSFQFVGGVDTIRFFFNFEEVVGYLPAPFLFRIHQRQHFTLQYSRKTLLWPIFQQVHYLLKAAAENGVVKAFRSDSLHSFYSKEEAKLVGGGDEGEEPPKAVRSLYVLLDIVLEGEKISAEIKAVSPGYISNFPGLILPEQPMYWVAYSQVKQVLRSEQVRLIQELMLVSLDDNSFCDDY